ncbi:excinuclease ABC subunit UvrA [Furfurilactobacillus curtus]|uniref:UvrABC system protein A n=1 Tax=Furfurilactobacillus curtus TaxID=1746200 RepID=A0ABQ5JNU5_9LACO
MVVQHKDTIPDNIEVRGARVNNLKNVSVDIPLNAFVAITGRSGSGKSSLAMGVLYAEGARRYLNALSTYTRRRISQVSAAMVDSVQYLPSALALRQRPQVPGVRSTVGTMSESLNVLRLMFSRLGSMVCPNGHRMSPTLAVAENDGWVDCPTCGIHFRARGAEDFAFNSAGACPTCGGLGEVRQIAVDRLIGDETKTIRQGAVNAWHLPGRNFMPIVAEAVGIRIDVPYKDLTEREKQLVLHGQKATYAINIPSRSGKIFHMDNAVYENAYNAVADSLATTNNERAIQRLNRFYEFDTCPTCQGTRFNPVLLDQLMVETNIATASQMDLDQLTHFANQIETWLPEDMRHLGHDLVKEFLNSLAPLKDLGLNYLTLDRAGNTLSTGELQRIQLGRTLRSETTGVLYVLDEPSVGLHPANVTGLIEVFHQLIAQGNSLVVVDHDTRIIGAADYVLEIGPGAGRAGGQVINQGTVAQIEHDESSLIAPFLNGTTPIRQRQVIPEAQLFKKGNLTVAVSQRFNLKHVVAHFPKNRLSVVSGMSGAGKTTLVLDSLIPAIQAQVAHDPLPKYVSKLDRAKLRHVIKVDSVPVGKNIRSTVATYTNILDVVRNLFANTKEAQRQEWSASHFSYNLNDGACPQCHGTGTISMDVQFLPDIEEVCPICHGQRYNPETLAIKWHGLNVAEVLALSVDDAREVFKDEPNIAKTLNALHEMGLGYLQLGESTPTLSGGEAQRLKLVAKMGQRQTGTLYVFDEPSVGLHPLDIRQLLEVFDQLIADGATVIVIEHDLDVIANADYVIDMGPAGGNHGGQVVAAGTPEKIAATGASVTGKYLKTHLNKQV